MPLKHPRLDTSFDDIHLAADASVTARPATAAGAGIPPGVVEVLDHGYDGEPRQLRLLEDAAAGNVRDVVARVSEAARARGFVPVSVEAYPRMPEPQAGELRDRTLLLLATRAHSDEDARRALVLACVRNPRAHLLLRVGAPPGAASLVREARARYGMPAPSASPRRRALHPDVERLRARLAAIEDVITAGRHVVAARMLREVAEAFRRRAQPDDAAYALIRLGRLLLERGRAADADRLFEDAASTCDADTAREPCLEARLWQASARTDAGRLSEAEAICRAVLVAPLAPPLQLLVHAALARVLLWQGRLAEAEQCVLEGQDESLDPVSHAVVYAMRVRLLLARGRIFEAGCHARALLDTVDGTSLPRLIAEMAHLRVITETGDLTLAMSCLQRVSALAAALRTPMRAVRARILVAAALARAGRAADAAAEFRRLRRLLPAVPGLVRQMIVEGDARPAFRPRPAAQGDADAAARLVALSQDVEEDDAALERIAAFVGEAVRAVRVDIWSHDAGPATAITSHGGGLLTRLGPRVLEAGVALGPERLDLGTELGAPVRRARSVAGAIVARWPADRQPPDEAQALMALAAAVLRPRLEAVQTMARTTSHGVTSMPELVGTSDAMRDVRAAVTRAAAAPFAVLLQGESGVGKELVARAIHQLGPRRERPFSDVNCAALPDDLIESELFGHAKGAFTGAVADRAGLFEAAAGGTVFLDEVADLSARGQAKLLRVLQQQEVRRVGETFTRPIDVRLVVAANRDLADEVAAGHFRSDLFYRLDVIRIRIPPLRERPQDIAPLALHFWALAAARVGTRATLTHAVLAALAAYHWPGNVRELQNVTSALAVAAPARGPVRAHLLPAAITGATVVRSPRLEEARRQFERRFIESALARASGNRSRAARELGLSRQGLLKMMARHRLVPAAGSPKDGTT